MSVRDAIISRNDEDPESLVLGIFQPEGIGAAMKAKGFDAQELAELLIDMIRHEKPKESLAAMAQLRQMAKEALVLNGNVINQSARKEVPNESADRESGGFLYEQSRKSLQSSLETRPQIGSGATRIIPALGPAGGHHASQEIPRGDPGPRDSEEPGRPVGGSQSAERSAEPEG